MQHGGGGDDDDDDERRGGTIDVTYQVTDTVEPSHQTVPLLGEVIFGDQTSLFARCSGLGTGAAKTPRAKNRRAAGNLIGNIIIISFVVDGSKQATAKEEKCRKRGRGEEGEDDGGMRYDIRTRKESGGSSSPLNTRKKRRAAVRRAANRMNPRKAPVPGES
jgi:hypothetical protein